MQNLISELVKTQTINDHVSSHMCKKYSCFTFTHPVSYITCIVMESGGTSRVYATVDARFDETYFPFRTTNQRVYGQDYSPSI